MGMGMGMGNGVLGITRILERLPHRYPFLFVDRVLERSAEEALVLKNVTIDEPFFQGHFPTEPIMPGVLLGEAMAQATAFIGEGDGDAAAMDRKVFLTGMHLKLEKPVVPGDQLFMRARLVKRLGKLMKFSVQATVGGSVVATAEITVATT